MHTPVRVLFVCDGGTARSRMAEALLRQQRGYQSIADPGNASGTIDRLAPSEG